MAPIKTSSAVSEPVARKVPVASLVKEAVRMVLRRVTAGCCTCTSVGAEEKMTVLASWSTAQPWAAKVKPTGGV